MSDTFCSRGLVSFQDYLESVLPSKKVLSFRIWVAQHVLPFLLQRGLLEEMLQLSENPNSKSPNHEKTKWLFRADCQGVGTADVSCRRFLCPDVGLCKR